MTAGGRGSGARRRVASDEARETLLGWLWTGGRRARRPRTPPEATNAECISGPKTVSNESSDQRVRGRAAARPDDLRLGPRRSAMRIQALTPDCSDVSVCSIRSGVLAAELGLRALLLGLRGLLGLAFIGRGIGRGIGPVTRFVAEERVVFPILGGPGNRGREGQPGGLVGWSGAVLQERVVLRPGVLEDLAGEGFEGRPPLALLASRDVGRRTGPGRDQLADDHVLLQADQVVLGAVDGRLGQHPGRLLEGRRGKE